MTYYFSVRVAGSSTTVGVTVESTSYVGCHAEAARRFLALGISAAELAASDVTAELVGKVRP